MADKATENSTICARPGLRTDYLEDGEAMIASPKVDVHYGLNSVGGRVWSLIQHPVTIRRVCDILLLEYDVEEERCLEEILLLVNNLVAMDLAVLSDG